MGVGELKPSFEYFFLHKLSFLYLDGELFSPLCPQRLSCPTRKAHKTVSHISTGNTTVKAQKLPSCLSNFPTVNERLGTSGRIFEVSRLPTSKIYPAKVKRGRAVAAVRKSGAISRLSASRTTEYNITYRLHLPTVHRSPPPTASESTHGASQSENTLSRVGLTAIFPLA